VTSARVETFSISLRPSRIYATGTLLLLLLSLFSIWWAAIPWLISLSLSLTSLITILWTAHRHVLLRHADSVVGIDHDGQFWHLTLADNRRIGVEIQGEVLLTPWLVAFMMRQTETLQPGRRCRFPVVIFADTVSYDGHRRLRLLLRIVTA